MRKVLVGFALVAILGLAAGAFYFYSQSNNENRQVDEAEAAQVADELAQTIAVTLQKDTPVSWVYDIDDTLLFALRVSDETSATSTVPEPVAQGLQKKFSQGMAQSIFRNAMIEKKLADKSDYFVEYGIECLQEKVSENDLMRYLTTIGTYGKVTGLENAAITFFNRDLAHLNSWQAEFLAYSYDNPDANVITYLAETGTASEQLEFIQNNIRNSALDAMIRAELQRMPEVKTSDASYTIRLSLSMAQQQALQSTVDTAMRSFIDLSSNGSYAVNASVAVLDNTTGLITAYIPGRTSNSVTSVEFEMNTSAWDENYVALISHIAQPGQTRYSLQTVKLPNGDFTFESIGQQWESQTLASGVSGSHTAIDILQRIKVILLSSSPSLIQQVKDLTGQVVYEAPGPEIQPPSNKTVLKLRQCFVEDGVESSKILSSDLQLSSGIVSFEMTHEYTAVVLLGSGVIGGEIAADKKDELKGVAQSIFGDIRSFFPTPKTVLYARTAEMAEEFTTTYDTNYELLSEGLGEKYEKLEAMVINSSDTRRAFETEYESLSAELKSLESFVSKQDYAWLVEDLHKIRQSKADDILRYSV